MKLPEIDDFLPTSGRWTTAIAIKAMQDYARAALAQTGAEPVAWAVYAIVDGQWSMQWPLSETREFAEVHAGMYGASYTVEVRPLYAAMAPEGPKLGAVEVDPLMPALRAM